jgi:Flp pilus assembly protein TadD
MEPHYFLGVALLNLGQKSAARTQLERALRLDPGNRAVEDALAKAQ